jgi:hypothetical protein
VEVRQGEEKEMSAKNIIENLLDDESNPEPFVLVNDDFEVDVTFGPKFEGPMGREQEPWGNCSIKVLNFSCSSREVFNTPEYDEFTNAKETGETIPALREAKAVTIYNGEWSDAFKLAKRCRCRNLMFDGHCTRCDDAAHEDRGAEIDAREDAKDTSGWEAMDRDE